MIDLRSYGAIESSLFIKWVIPNFETATLSDYNLPITFGGDTYTNVGELLSVSSTTAELKASASQLSIQLSGIPATSISDLLNNEIKGSNIEVFRGLFDPTTHALLSVGDDNPIKKFEGIVTNYAISDSVDPFSNSASTTITLTCNSMVEVLAKKINGRRTNPVDFPDENSMDRVQPLSNSNYNFGAP